jgi:hypothetical protein
MLAGLSSAARFLLLILANPNWLLFVKHIKIVKVGENRALEFTTYSRNAITREIPVTLPTISPPPPPPRKGLLFPLPALAAISGLAISASSQRTIGTPTVRSISWTSPAATAKLLKSAAPAQPAARRAEEREQGKLTPSPAGLRPLSRPERPLRLPLLMTAIGAAATARGLLLPSHLKVDVALPPLLEATCGLALPLLADAALGAPAALLCALTLLCLGCIMALLSTRHGTPVLALARALSVASEAAVPIAQAVATSDGAPAATLLPRLGVASAIDAVCALVGTALGGSFGDDGADGAIAFVPCVAAIVSSTVALVAGCQLLMGRAALSTAPRAPPAPPAPPAPASRRAAPRAARRAALLLLPLGAAALTATVQLHTERSLFGGGLAGEPASVAEPNPSPNPSPNPNPKPNPNPNPNHDQASLRAWLSLTLTPTPTPTLTRRACERGGA